MHAPSLELEGTWEQNILFLPDLVQQIAARTIALNLLPDTRDYLREGRNGEMYNRL